MVDVTIRGAGIFGLSIAWTCARRGAKVQVIDPFGPGAGSSGGIVGALSPHTPERWIPKKAFQFESLIMSEPFWADVQAVGGVSSGYGRIGRLQPINNQLGLDLAHERAINVKTLWQGKATWQVRPASDFDTWVPPSATGFVIHDTLSARMHPRRACAALVAALTTLGVTINTDAPDRGQVVHATGLADLELMTQQLNRLVGNGVKGQAALLHHNAGDVPQLFTDGIHFIPHADGTLAIGSTSERFYDNPTTTDTALEDLIERAVAVLPVLHGAKVIERWAGVRPRGITRAPIMGAHPLHAGQFIANGGFKIGFGVAPKVASTMADLILEGRDTIPDDFRVEASL